MKLTQSKLKLILYYNKVTGDFIWQSSNKKYVTQGTIAGFIHSSGYVIIGIDGKNYKAHRLAFLYMLGEFPPKLVDHINKIKNDNSWVNLRLATYSENGQNRKDNNKVCGIYWNKPYKKWLATTPRKNKIRDDLGYFSDWFDAVCCRKSWENKNNWKSFK